MGLRPKIKLMHLNGHEKVLKQPQRSSLRYVYPSEGYTCTRNTLPPISLRK
jgi:hypothetical protein